MSYRASINVDTERTHVLELQQLLTELCQDLTGYLGTYPTAETKNLLVSVDQSLRGEQLSRCSALIHLWAEAVARLNEPLLGIKVAAYRPTFVEVDSSVHRPLSSVSMRFVLRHQTISGTSTSGRLEQGLPEEAFYCTEAAQQIRELLTVRSLQRFRRVATDRSFCFLSSGRSPMERSTIARLLKCESQNGPSTGLSWSSPHPQADTHSKLSKLRVRLNTLLRTHQCSDLNHAASALGVSCRTLQRMLSASGTTFSRVLGETRFAYAKELLVEDDLNVTEVSRRLGFADSVAFRRAFRRWTGTTPSCYRTAQRREHGRALVEMSS